MRHSMRKAGSMLAELRAPFLAASILPVVAGAAVAVYRTGGLRPGLLLLSVLGVACVHAGANVLNDYFDHKSGNDEANRDFVRPFTGGSRMIQRGRLTPREVRRLGGTCLVAGALFAAWLAVLRGPVVLVLAVGGIVLGYAYSATSLRLSHRGWGEVVVGVAFGFLPVMGSEFIQARGVSACGGYAAATIAVLIVAVLFINQFQDRRADGAVGKRTWVVRLGTARAARVHAVLCIGWVLPVLVGVASGRLPALSLAACSPLPLGWFAARHCLRYAADGERLVAANKATLVLHHLVSVILSVSLLLGRMTG